MYVMTESEGRPPFPPFTHETALQKVQAAEDAWNTRDPERVSKSYTVDSQWRNRSEHVVGRDEIVAFLTRKWQRELDYSLRKSLWDFNEAGLMTRREASINDVPIDESERRYFGARPAAEHGQDIVLW